MCMAYQHAGNEVTCVIVEPRLLISPKSKGFLLLCGTDTPGIVFKLNFSKIASYGKKIIAQTACVVLLTSQWFVSSQLTCKSSSSYTQFTFLPPLLLQQYL